MLLRLRSRDGLERIEVPDNASVAALRALIHEQLGVPLADMHLSKQAGLLTSKEPYSFRDLAVTDASLRSLGIAHGDMVFLLYSGQREVQSVMKKGGGLGGRPFGEVIKLADIMAKQVKIVRQEKAKAGSVSFDRSSANAFQSYLQSAFKFSVKRGGILYGTTDEAGAVKVDFIYEPPQDGNGESLSLERHTLEEQQVDFLAGLLSYKKVGLILSQSLKQRDAGYIVNTQEVLLMAGLQAEVGEACVSVLVTWEESAEAPGGGQVHFEAFQCSEQATQLARDGWLTARQPPSGITLMVHPTDPTNKTPVMLGTKDVDEIDNDYFLVPVKILDHEGKLTSGVFPIENRLMPQTKAELRDALKRSGPKSYVERLSDFHLLLWLSKQPNLDPHDMALLCEAVKTGQPIMEGYSMIVDCIAGIQ